MQTLSFNRSIDQLEENIISLARRSNELEYEFLKAVQEFDIRQGWRLWHLNNCAEWLNLKCGIAPGTAREKVRVARALFDLPKSSAAFARGELSYSKARSLTRVATRENEEDLVDYACNATASQVQTYCNRIRNGQASSTDDANRAHHARWLSCSNDGDGMMTLSATLPQEAGELFIKAIELAGNALEDDDAVDGFFARQADALIEIARSYLAGGNDKPRSSADNYQVLVHVDESALKHEGGETSLDNCILLCSKHHRLLHEGGYSIESNYRGERYFKTSQGKCIADDASRDACRHAIAEAPAHYGVVVSLDTRRPALRI